ncbi:MAG: c-type cytochrome [Planctomycetes bacterium]|nr:c-type cytochrome [Planctomycetota bacterium]
MLRTILTTSLAILALGGAAQAADTPLWIWNSPTASNNQTVCFRKNFTVDAVPASAKLMVTGDNHAAVFINGVKVGSSDEWKEPVSVDVAKHLKAGSNIIAVEGRNDDGAAAMVAKIVLKGKDGKTTEVVSDASWKSGEKTDGWEKADFNDATWKTSTAIAKLGSDPWGDVFANAGKPGAGSVIAADNLQLLPGFKAELLYVVPKSEQGSWVALTADDKGRLIASDQGGAGLYRITPPPVGGSMDDTKVERLTVELGSAQGLLYAYDALYVSINGKHGKNGAGLYRAKDTNGDDQFDTVEQIKAYRGGGEHGPHAVIKGPDGRLYVCAGNHTDVPEGIDTFVAPKIWQEDQVLPRHVDPNGHAANIRAPGGWIASLDKDGKDWRLLSVGWRNQYDIAFDTSGELFSYDADMEWDLGSAWYRPTRVCHVTSGSEFGWRTGSGKWPAYYPDSLPSTIDIGPGSPVGIEFGTEAKFPAKYQRALYILDWTYGTCYAIHTEQKGASYTATREDFIYGKPFPVTDLTIGKDGAMYVAIGGRGTQSALYRLTYAGSESTAKAAPLTVTPEAKLRRSLEAFHGKQDPAAVKAALPHLGHSDRFIRFAARTALEHQPVAQWQDQVLAEKSPLARINGLVGVARVGDKAVIKDKSYAAALELEPSALDLTAQLELIRAIGLLTVRMGLPDPTTAQKIAVKFDALYPSNDPYLNRELAGLLAVLGSPMVVQKTVERMGAEEIKAAENMEPLVKRNDGYGRVLAELLGAQPQAQGMQYALALSAATNGWTPELRKKYFTWFIDAEAGGKGGNSFKGFLRVIQKDAMSKVPEAERAALAPDKLTAGVKKAPPAPIPTPKGPGKNWTMAEVEPLVKGKLTKRDFANGKAMYQATQCAICHRFVSEGGAVGPDLTSAGTKFSPKDLLESIIDPSKVISDQYATSSFITKDGLMVIGKLMGEENGSLLIATSPLDPSQTTLVKKDDITTTAPMKVSVMPPGLLNRLNQDEVLDLIAYLISGGNEQDKMFAK